MPNTSKINFGGDGVSCTHDPDEPGKRVQAAAARCTAFVSVAERARVGLASPLSGAVPLRTGWACRMPNLSVVPVARIELALSAYETAVLPLDETGVKVLELVKGLAPSAACLQNRCSAVELHQQVEPPARIGLASHLYQRCALPLDDGGVVPTGGIEPPFPACHAGGLPLTYAGVVGTT